MSSSADRILVEIVGNSTSAVRASEQAAASIKGVGTAAKSASVTSATAAQATAASWKKTGATMSHVGGSMTRYLTLPILAVGAAAVKMSLDFNRGMESLHTQAGASQKEVGKLSKQLLALGAKGRFAQGPKELTEALFDIESVGFRGAKAMKALKAASDLASVGHAGLESTTSALVGVLKTGIKGAGNMKQAIGTLNATIGAGKLHMEDLNAAIGTGFAGTARGLGVSLTGLGAALAELTSQGVPASAAATRLRITMSLIANPTEKAQKALAGIGIGSEDLAKKMRSSGSLVPALEEIQTKMKEAGLTAVQQGQLLAQAFGGAKSGGTIVQLLGQLDDLSTKQKEIIKNAGSFNEKLEATKAEEADKLARAWSEMQFTLTKLGNVLLPKVAPLLEEVAGAVSGALDSFNGLSPSTQDWILKLTLAAVALGPILKMLGTALKIAGAIRGMSLFSGAAAAAGAGAGAAGAGAAAGEAAAAGAGAGMSAGMTAGLVAFPVAIAAAGIYKIATHTGHEMGDKIAAGLGQEFEQKYGPNIQKALQAKDVGRLEGLQKRLKFALDAAIATGADEASLKPLREKLGNLRTVIIPSVTWPRRAAESGIAELKAGLVTRMADINQVFQTSLSKINEGWARGSGQWREKSTEGMRGVIAAIKAGMAKGLITGEAGGKRIQEMLRGIALTEGKDPFKIAAGFASGWKQAGRVNDTQIDRAITEMKRMPKGAREAAEEAMERMASALERKGKLVKGSAAKVTSALVATFGASDKQMSFGVAKAMAEMSGSFGSFAGAVAASLNSVGLNVDKMLGAFGIKGGKKFGNLVTGLVNIAGSFAGFQRGGPIDLGAPSGDTVPAMLERGEYVLNRKAVAAMGKDRLDTINFAAAPRFAKGGGLGPEPHLTGPGVLRTIGQAAIHEVYEGAKSYLAKHKPKLGPGGAPGYTGPPATFKQLGDNAYVDSHTLAVTAFLDKKFGLSMTDGFRTAAEAAQYPSGQGSLHTHGSPSNPGATDSAGGPISSLYAYIAYAKKHVAGLQEAMVDNVAGWNAHLGFFAKGGRVPGFAGGGRVLSKAGQNARDLMQQVWPAAAPFYGRSSSSKMPRTNFDTTAWGGAFVGDTKVYGPHGHLKKNFLVLPKWFEGYLSKRGEAGKAGPDIFKETLLHEWAHYFQREKKDWTNADKEGGAEAFARTVAPGVYAAAGIPFHLPPLGKNTMYYPFVQHVLKDRGMDWVMKGQFGRKHGGLVGGIPGFAKGGSVQKLAAGKLVGASTYGGPADSVSGTVGSSGVSLPGKMAFAELDMGKALGGLPYHFKMKVDHAGRSVIGEKLDIGAGGGPVGGKHRSIDLWYQMAEALGVGNNWLGVVRVEPASGKGAVGGAGSTKESVPASFHGARTGKLSFGEVPKSLGGVERELARRRSELHKYRTAAAAAEGKPATQQALQANVTALEGRIRELERARLGLRRKAAQRKISARFAKALGRITGYENQITAAQRSYEEADQKAGQITDLEPQPTEPPAGASEADREAGEKAYIAKFKNYIDTQESPAFLNVLGAENIWRNTILGGESQATGMERNWEARVRKIGREIEATDDYTKKVAGDVSQFRKAHPKTDFPDWLNKEIKQRDQLRNKLPMQRFKERELRDTLGEARGEFYPGGGNPVSPPSPPLPGSGSFEDALTSVQGVHWPDQHEALGGLPTGRVPGFFGGAIWDTQTAIAELALKIPAFSPGGGGGGSEQDSELASLLKEQVAQTQRNLRLSEGETKTFGQFFSELKGLPWLGAFEKGGLVDRTGIGLLHGGEMVLPAPQGPAGSQGAASASGGSAPVNVQLHLSDKSGELVQLIDARVNGQIANVDTILGGRARRMAFAPGRV